MTMNRMCEIFCILFLLGAVFLIGACGGGGGGSSPNSGSTQNDLTGQLFADEVVDRWLGVDYSIVNPIGTTDSDGDGEVDTNDAVNFIETLNALGYDLPPTTIYGLYNNYYTDAGYAQTDDLGLVDSEKIEYSYTLNNPLSQADLQAFDWSRLSVGDLIFVDFDKDNVWDFAAVYLGVYGSFDHAVVFASDYYDEVTIENLDDPTSIIVQDIAYGYCDVKTPDYDAISNY
jgi:hypothetical protein